MSISLILRTEVSLLMDVVPARLAHDTCLRSKLGLTWARMDLSPGCVEPSKSLEQQAEGEEGENQGEDLNEQDGNLSDQS